MDWKQHCRARLPEHLDAQGDLAPPWAKFPQYERYTIGWRMGSGEDWMGLWHVFLEGLPAKGETRLAYLRRHPPAPFTWAGLVSDVLHPEAEDEDEEGDDGDGPASTLVAELSSLGLIASDIAFHTWLGQQPGIGWPWEHDVTPVTMARHWTRDFWFWSRQVAACRSAPGWQVPPVPAAWGDCALALATGAVPSLDLSRGLLSLAQMLCAGEVTPPWKLGLTFADFTDSFEDDMGFVDAYRLWGMSAFDDAPHLLNHLELTQAPPAWRDWAAEQCGLVL